MNDIWYCDQCERFKSIDSVTDTIGGILLPGTKDCKSCKNKLGTGWTNAELRVKELNLLIEITEQLEELVYRTKQ